jgi:small subunit ribosomal protein S16
LAVRIRLTRVGATKRPAYRVIAIDKRRSRDGRALEILGFYDPLTEPATVHLETARIDAWIGNGAQPSETVLKLMRQAEREAASPTPAEKPKRPSRPKASSKPSAKAAAKAPKAEAAAADDGTAGADAPATEAAETDAPPEATEATVEGAAGGGPAGDTETELETATEAAAPEAPAADEPAAAESAADEPAAEPEEPRA